MRKRQSKIAINKVLLAVYISLLVALGTIRYVEQHGIVSSSKTLRELTAVSSERRQLLTDIWSDIVNRRTTMLRYLYDMAPQETELLSMQVATMTATIEKNIAAYKSLISDNVEAELFNKLIEAEAQLNEKRERALHLAESGRKDEVKAFGIADSQPVFEKIEIVRHALNSYAGRRDLDQIAAFNETIKSKVRLSTALTYMIAIFLLALGVVIIYTVRAIVRKQDQLRESELRYRTVTEQSHELIIRLNATGKVVFANPKTIALFKYSNEELQQLTIFDLLAEDSAAQAREDFRQVHEGGNYKTRVRGAALDRNGYRIDIEGTILWEFRNGVFDGQTAFLNDVTERNMLQRSLRQSEHKFRTLFDMAPIPMFTFHPESYRFLQVNAAMTEHYGYSEEELLRKTIMDIRPASEVNRTKELVEHLMTGKGGHNDVYHHITRDGKMIEVEIFDSKVVIDGVTQIISTVVDVTERKQYENRITQAILRTQEEERYEIGGELHDNVCQILASAKMSMSMMKSKLPEGLLPMYDRSLESIIMATDEIRNLSHRLAPVFFRNTTLKESLERLLATFNLANDYVISIHFDPSVEKLQLSEELQLNIYRIAQEQLRNIVKHANATKVTFEMTFYRGKLHWGISDNGNGFKTSETPTGIGLANIRRRAEFFGGKMQIFSSPGDGCELLVTIPLED